MENAILSEVWVVEYSRAQRSIHVDTLAKTLASNFDRLIYDQEADFIPVAAFDTPAEAHEFCNQFRRRYPDLFVDTRDAAIELHADTITVREMQKLLASGDDSFNNELRVEKNGRILLYQIVPPKSHRSDLAEVAFRFEAFEAGEGYIGPANMQDEGLAKLLIKAIQLHWEDYKSDPWPNVENVLF